MSQPSETSSTNTRASEPAAAHPVATNPVRSGVQKAAVRVIASELDRRSSTLERALSDLGARVDRLTNDHEIVSEQIALANDYVKRVHDHLLNVEALHTKLSGQYGTLFQRVEIGDIERNQNSETLAELVEEFENLRSAMARMDALVQRRSQ
jgi:chromosome segregation ATPase